MPISESAVLPVTFLLPVSFLSSDSFTTPPVMYADEASLLTFIFCVPLTADDEALTVATLLLDTELVLRLYAVDILILERLDV